MYSDPFENIYKLERREIRNKSGCANCKFRDIKAWDVWSCKKGMTASKRGFCKFWRFDEEKA